MSAPLISVVLPTHNRRPLLERSVRSVLGQTHARLELIVVDDASTDGTPALLQAWPDPRLRYVRRAARGGPAAARNEGVALATGEFVAFQDSDDEWLTTKLEAQLRLLREAGPSTALAVGSYLVAEPAGARLVRSPALIRGESYERDFIKGYPVATPLWLVPREVLRQAGPFDESLPCLEDWDLCFRIARLGRLRSVREVVLLKHGHSDAISSDMRNHAAGLQEIYRRHAGAWHAFPEAHAALLAEIGRLQCRHGARAAGLRWLVRAARLEPWSPTRYVALAAAAFGRTALRGYAGRLAGRRRGASA